MVIKIWRKSIFVCSLFLFSNALKAQEASTETKKTIDSSYIKSAIDLNTCIQNQKKLLGKEVQLKGFCVGSTEIGDEKEGSFYVLELDDAFPNNKISIIITDLDADSMSFSRYQYHQKQLYIKGKLEKSKKFKDEFGNPRLVIHIKQLKQINF